MRMLGVSLWGKPVLCKNEPTVSGYVAWRGAQSEVLIFHPNGGLPEILYRYRFFHQKRAFVSAVEDRVVLY